jgi:hypothetical protein
MQAIAFQILQRRLDATPGLGGALGPILHANALMDGRFLRSFRSMDYEKLAREFDDGCVLHADLPVLAG